MRVVIISPFRGDRNLNWRYAVACGWDSVQRGESPFIPHLLYPQFLDDDNLHERVIGMKAGRAWMLKSSLAAVYINLGISEGMQEDIHFAQTHDIRLDERSLAPDVMERVHCPTFRPNT